MKKIKHLTIIMLLGLMLLPAGETWAACEYNDTNYPMCNFPGCCIPEGGPPFPGCPPCVDVPLDGGLSALMLVGLVFGARRIYGKAQ